MKLKVTAILAFAFFFAFANLTIAQVQNEDVSSSLEVVKITTNDNGEEVAEQVTTITPGDTLEYRVEYTNNLDGAISNLQPMLPIPAGLQYLAGTATPEISVASLDAAGETFQSLPIMREETTEAGLVVEREVPASEYRRLRWTVATLGAQQSITVTARMRVIKETTR